MAIAASKRPVMKLYASSNNLFCHQTLIVLAEKGVMFDMIEVSPNNVPKELLGINPVGSIPTLVDRDLVLTDPHIIMEYLDERFPHPPLLPVYPVARAKSRLMKLRIEREWYRLIEVIETGASDASKQAHKFLQEQLSSIAPLFSKSDFCLSEEFSLVDCCLAPLLWRLPELKLDLPPKAKEIKAYAERIFKRPSFKASVIELEKDNKK